MTESLRFAKNLGVLYSAEIVSHVIGFIVSVYIARVFGSEAFGQISFSLVLLSYFVLFTNFGLATYGIKEVSHNVKRTTSIASTLILIQAVLSIIAYSVLIILITAVWGHFPSEKKYLILILGLSMFPTVFDLTWVFMGHEKMEFRAIAYSIRYLTYALIVFLFLPIRSTIITVGIAYLSSTVIMALFSTSAYLKSFHSFRFVQSDLAANLKIFLRGALPIGWATLMSRVYYNFDTLMLSFLRSDQVVGWYSAAYRIVLVLTGIAGIYGMVYLPALTKRIRVSKSAAKALVNRSFKILLSFSVPITVGGILLSSHIIKFIFGEQYLEAIVPFQILLIAVLIIFTSVVFSYAMISLGKQKQLAIYSTLAAVFNVGLNFLVIPRYGAVGAAITTVISEATVFTGVYYVLRKEMLAPSLVFFLRPVVAAGCMAAPILLKISGDLIILLLLSILVYVTVLYIIGGISNEDLHLIKQILRRKV
ncbi:MAG: flippase [candidate division WOR-3 bacterium]|nr:MAG: flippase [candidate division WOR-3 bacterium]